MKVRNTLRLKMRVDIDKMLFLGEDFRAVEFFFVDGLGCDMQEFRVDF